MKEQLEKEKENIDTTIISLMAQMSNTRKVKEEFDQNYRTVMESYNDQLDKLQKHSVSINIQIQGLKQL